MIVMMITSLYTSRVIIAALGIDDYGIYNVVGGVVACLGFLNGTLSTASSRYITVALGNGDINRMKDVFSSVLLVNVFFCIIVLVLSESIGLWFLYNKMIIPQERMNAAFEVYQLSVLTVILNIISVPYNASIIAHERMKAFAYITLFDAFAKLGVAFLITCVCNIDKLVLYASLLFSIQVFDRIIYGQYCLRHFPETKFKFHVDRQMFKDMTGFIGWASYGSLVSMGFTQGLNILLNLFFGPAINAARAIAVQVQNAIVSFVTNFQIAINPQLTKDVAAKNYDNSKFLLITSSKISFFLMCILGIPIIVNIDYILDIWLKEVPDHAQTFVQLMLIICLFQTLANPIRIVNQAEGNIKKFQIYECSCLALIVPLSYVFLKMNFCAESVFLIQLFIEITVHIIRIYIVLPKILMSKKEYIHEIYIRIIPVFFISLMVAYTISVYMPVCFWSFMTNCIVSFFFTILLIFYVGLTQNEKNTLKAIIRKRLN